MIWHHGLLLGSDSFLRTLQHNARHGVALFFVISGFLIASLLLRERRVTGRIDLSRFYARRALRLFPLYYFILGIHALLIFSMGFYAPQNQSLFNAKLWSYVFYFSNWLESSGQGPFFQAWSLAAEEQFYFIFAAAAVICRARILVPTIVAMLAVKFMVFSAAPDVESVWPTTRVLLSYQEPILLGVLVAYVLNSRKLYLLIARYFGGSQMWLALLVSILLVFLPPNNYSGFQAQLIYLSMAALVAACVIRKTISFPGVVLLSHIGKVSYGIYLLHMLVIAGVKKVPFIDDPFTCFAVTIAVAVPIATCAYECIEVPFIRLARKRFAVRSPASIRATAPPGVATVAP